MFIGSGSIILCNVTIGDNVIIGAGSVVTKNLASNGIYVGNPARYICSFEEYGNKYFKMREERPILDNIRPWNTWEDATDEERKTM